MVEEQEAALSKALIALFKGVIFKERQPELWQTVLEQRAQISDYAVRLGLILLIDEVDAYAFLRQSEQETLPRLVPRYPLSYGLSLLLVSLRKSLGEYDASHGDTRLVLTLGDMQLKLKAFFPALPNEIKFRQNLERHVHRAEEMGFLRPAAGREDAYEVQPLLRSFINAEWLHTFDDRLQEYLEYGQKELTEGEDSDGLI